MAVKSLSIRIDEEMLDKLHVLADYEGRSANSQILILIRDAIENYEEKESPQLFVEYTDDTPFTKESCDFYSVEQSEYATRIVFSTDGVLHDFKLLSLCMTDVDEEGNPEYSIDDIYSYGTLEAYRPLIVELVFYGDTPSYGVSYTDETGETRRLAVSMSGYDGSLALFEF